MACSPAPVVERRAPIRITHFVGHERAATVRRPLASPNWSRSRKRSMVAPKNKTQVRSVDSELRGRLHVFVEDKHIMVHVDKCTLKQSGREREGEKKE